MEEKFDPKLIFTKKYFEFIIEQLKDHQFFSLLEIVEEDGQYRINIKREANINYMDLENNILNLITENDPFEFNGYFDNVVPFNNGIEVNIIEYFSNTNNEIIFDIESYTICKQCGHEAFKNNLCLECLAAEYGRSL